MSSLLPIRASEAENSMSYEPLTKHRHHHRGRIREQEWTRPIDNTNISTNDDNPNFSSTTSNPSRKRRHRHHHRARSLEHNMQSTQHVEDDTNTHSEQPGSSSTSSHRRRRRKHTNTHFQAPENHRIITQSRRSRSVKSRSEKASDDSSDGEETQKGSISKREFLHELALKGGRKVYEGGRDENEEEKKGWKYHTSIAASSDLPDKQLKANVTMEKNVKLKGVEYMAFRLLKLQDQNVKKHEIPGIGAIGVQVLDGHRHAITGLKVAKKKGREAKVVVSIDLHLPVKL